MHILLCDEKVYRINLSFMSCLGLHVFLSYLFVTLAILLSFLITLYIDLVDGALWMMYCTPPAKVPRSIILSKFIVQRAVPLWSDCPRNTNNHDNVNTNHLGSPAPYTCSHVSRWISDGKVDRSWSAHATRGDARFYDNYTRHNSNTPLDTVLWISCKIKSVYLILIHTN